MLTVFRWRHFWFSLLRGAGFFLLLLVVYSSLFFAPFIGSSQATPATPWSVVVAVLETFPFVVTLAIFKMIGMVFLMGLVLQALSSALSRAFRALAYICFFSACVLRMAMLYPSSTQGWWVGHQFSMGAKLLGVLTRLPAGQPAFILLSWLPFAVLAIVFLANMVLLIRFLIVQRERFNVVKRGIMVEDLERESRRSAMGAVAMVLAVAAAVICLICLANRFTVEVSAEDSGQFRPHIFVFAIDSLRTDRALQKEFANVMPFLHSKLDDAELVAPMLVGVPRALPSWVEFSTCRFAPGNGVRTLFPGKKERLGSSAPGVVPQERIAQEPDTLFSAARKAGYTTLFVSDDRGGIFSRYPFGAERLFSPGSNLSARVESAFISILAPLQGILAHPKLHRALENLQVNPAFADPRFLGLTVASALNNSTPFGRPVFLTTYFTASHFPYSPPNPYHRMFEKNERGTIIPERVSEQTPEQMIARYDGSLRAIDDSLKNIWEALEKEGWLNHAIVVVMGDHGENLFEGELGNGHGLGVNGEFSTQTPLVVWTKGRAEESLQLSQDNTLVRSVDLAPTLSRRAQFPFDTSQCDGIPLLDINDKRPQFPNDAAYQETDVWPASGTQSPENQERVNYPPLSQMLDLDPSMNFEFELLPEFAAGIASVKERAWVTEKYRLVARTSVRGTQFSLYNRKLDSSSSFDLLRSADDRSEARAVAAELTRQLNEYLVAHGVEIVRNSEGRFFYSENVSR